MAVTAPSDAIRERESHQLDSHHTFNQGTKGIRVQAREETVTQMNKPNRKTWRTTATAMAATAVLTLSGCGTGTADSSANAAEDTFVAGGLFPLTGTAAYLGPSNVSTMKLAEQDIDEAGGVLGNKISTITADTSDAEHADQNATAVQSVLSKNPSVVIGPPLSSVVKNTYKQVTTSKIPMISPGATSTAFSGLDDYFFRTIPPDTVQGVVMGDLIAQDGIKNLAIAVFNDEYGISLRAEVLKTLKEGGVNVVYGETETFDPAENNFSSIATNIKATNPDAVLVIAADQTIPPVKELAAKGIDTHKLYMPDSNMVDHSEDFTSGLLKGSKGTIPGAHPTSEFQNALKTIAPDTTIYTYNTETYDAMVLAALAAEKGGAADGETVQKNLMAVSGTTKGEKCESYEDCVALMKSGKEIQYVGKTSIGVFNNAHDPSTASIGIYEYDDSNVPVFLDSQEGAVPQN